jgi:hypothetical protein
MSSPLIFAESNLHVKKILRGSAHIFSILTNSSDLSHKRPWKIQGMVLVKGLKKRLGVRVVFRFERVHRALFRSSVNSIGSPSMVASTDLVGSDRSPSPYTHIQRKSPIHLGSQPYELRTLRGTRIAWFYMTLP